jgi:ribosomal protein S6--L-glutamate ligase
MITEPKHFILSVSDQVGNDKIYYKGKRIYKNSIDFIIVRVGHDFLTGKKVVEHLTNNLGIPSTATSIGMESASDKFLSSQVLSANKVMTPKAVHFKETSEYSLLKRLVGGSKFVVKLLTGSQGAGVFIVNDDESGSTALSTVSKIRQVVLQQYIETAKKDENKSDIRAFVVGGKVVAAMRRYSIKGDFRSNYSISKTATSVKLTEDQNKLAIDAANAFGLAIAGVDIITDINTGINYVLEINSNPGMGIIKVTGINIPKYIAEVAKTHKIENNKLRLLNAYESSPDAEMAIEFERKNMFNKMDEPAFSFNDDNDQGLNENAEMPENDKEQELSIIHDNEKSFMTKFKSVLIKDNQYSLALTERDLLVMSIRGL